MRPDAADTPASPTRMTLQQWADLDEDEPGELVDGVLVEEEMPSFLHEAVVAWLIHTLRTWAAPRGGWVFGSEAKLGVAAARGRKPDVCMYLPGARPPTRSDAVARVPPSVVVEVVSSRPRDGRRDRVEKSADYARFGVAYYWLIDPRLQTLEVFELEPGGRYAVALSASTGAHPAPGCAELVIDLDALWAEGDRLPDGDDETAE